MWWGWRRPQLAPSQCLALVTVNMSPDLPPGSHLLSTDSHMRQWQILFWLLGQDVALQHQREAVTAAAVTRSQILIMVELSGIWVLSIVKRESCRLDGPAHRRKIGVGSRVCTVNLRCQVLNSPVDECGCVSLRDVSAWCLRYVFVISPVCTRE